METPCSPAPAGPDDARKIPFLPCPALHRPSAARASSRARTPLPEGTGGSLGSSVRLRDNLGAQPPADDPTVGLTAAGLGRNRGSGAAPGFQPNGRMGGGRDSLLEEVRRGWVTRGLRRGLGRPTPGLSPADGGRSSQPLSGPAPILVASRPPSYSIPPPPPAPSDSTSSQKPPSSLSPRLLVHDTRLYISPGLLCAPSSYIHTLLPFHLLLPLVFHSLTPAQVHVLAKGHTVFQVERQVACPVPQVLSLTQVPFLGIFLWTLGRTGSCGVVLVFIQ